jgi:hypothetical protein
MFFERPYMTEEEPDAQGGNRLYDEILDIDKVNLQNYPNHILNYPNHLQNHPNHTLNCPNHLKNYPNHVLNLPKTNLITPKHPGGGAAGGVPGGSQRDEQVADEPRHVPLRRRTRWGLCKSNPVDP